MAVELQELLLGEQAGCLAQVARASAFSFALLDRVSAKKFDELDIMEAISTKEAGKTGAHTDPVLPVGKPGNA